MPSAVNPEDDDYVREPNHDAFKGTLEFDIYSWESEGALFPVFGTYPLSYDTVKISVKAMDGETVPMDLINLLIFCCSDTLEVLDVKHKMTRFVGFA